ncbi:hypothetical protein [Pseudoduganella sp.]|uniref:hypothetical protein n=1 Tax=Pseudoduganella sp. TaxID=1880898 RepID=UPI0035B182E1
MRQFMISCAICCASALGAATPPAHAEDTLFRCIDPRGTVVLTDRPCETTADTRRALPEKEYFVLPPSEQGRSHWVRKAPVRVPPKIDVETLRLARQALDLRDKVASAR